MSFAQRRSSGASSPGYFAGYGRSLEIHSFSSDSIWVHVKLHRSLLAVFELNELFDGDVEFFRKGHFGVEVYPWSWSGLRGGVSQGNGSLGANLGPISCVYYGVEFGKVPGQVTDYRHTTSIRL
jgi:hypothetical protein